MSNVQEKYGFENPFATDPLVKRAVTYFGGTKVLDVGCGEGADSVFFARAGFKVTGIDRNDAYLNRFRAYKRDHKLSSITIIQRNAATYSYPPDAYNIISCILVLCCMRRSQFDRMLPKLKLSDKQGGIVIMSSRNYLDPDPNDYRRTQKTIEPNTFRHKEDCCRFTYFIEKKRLREVFNDFEVIYYFEGYRPCKYNEHPRHGDSLIICRRPIA